MALEAQDNPFPYVTLTETADPSTPAANTQRLWLDTDGVIKVIDESATVTPVISASGAVATDAIWDAAGDLVQGTGSNTAAKLGAGTAGQFLMSAGAAAANLWGSRELVYAENTGNTSPTATTEATANTVVTAGATAFDGATIVVIEFYSDTVRPRTDAAGSTSIWLYDDTGGGAASIGRLGVVSTPATGTMGAPVHLSRRMTPSAATHTFSVRASVSGGTGLVSGGAGGTSTPFPAYIRITRAL